MEQVGSVYPVKITHFPPSMSSIVTITNPVYLGSIPTLTLQSLDSLGMAYYEATYVYTLTFTGPTFGTGTPVHSANGLYSATFDPTKIGSYSIAVTLSNSYTTTFPSISTSISGSPKTITVIGPTWSTTTLTTNFYIYAVAANMVTLPA